MNKEKNDDREYCADCGNILDNYDTEDTICNSCRDRLKNNINHLQAHVDHSHVLVRQYIDKQEQQIEKLKGKIEEIKEIFKHGEDGKDMLHKIKEIL